MDSEALEEIKNFLKSWKSRAFLERFSEPRKIRPKKKSVLFSRGLESGCRNFCSFRRPFLLEFCRVNNFPAAGPLHWSGASVDVLL